MAALCLALALPGCAETPDAINPVSWWHSLEGGEIAAGRPPPPKDNAPFPRLTDAPSRPAGMPDWEWQAMSATLAAQRAQAQGYAAANPIPTLPNPPPVAPAKPAAAAPAAATPAVAAPATVAAAPDDGTSAMTFNGPTSKPTTTGPKIVPIPGSATSSPTTKTKTTFFAPNNTMTIPGALEPPVKQADEASLPPVPTTMPLPPSVAGFDVPQNPGPAIPPPPPPPQPAAYVPPPPLPLVAPLRVAFPPGSAVLSIPMQTALRSFAASRKGARVAVTGFGDAEGNSIADQAAAMPLALERARAITVQLMAFGVKVPPLATDARAAGRGGLARLTD